MTQERFSIYRPIHKAIRHILFSTSRQLGLADFGDDAVTQETLANLDATIEFLREHRSHEDVHVHTALERKIPGITASFAEDHEEDDRLTQEIEQLATRIKSATGAQRVELGVEVHERYNAYLGIYLGHLYREETVLQQALWDNFTDEELIAIDGAIAGEIAPERMGLWLTEMCASYNPDEITLILSIVKSEAPPEVFQGITQLAESVMQPAMWAKVRARI
jgi:hypothetical protein